MSTSDLDRLGRESYVSLTTFRKNGQAVASAVRAVADGGRLPLQTFPGTGKAERPRHSARVTVAPCVRTGGITRGAVEGLARLLEGCDSPPVRRGPRREYGWRFHPFQVTGVSG